MRRIWTENGFVEDDHWTVVDDVEAAATDDDLIWPFNAFLENAESPVSDGGQGAVLLSASDDVRRLAPYLDRLALIALTFPAFNDGRAFSQATLLRQRLGYRGEIRAVGDVLIDQIPLMLRCGIDSFAVTNPVAIKRLEDGRLNGIPLHYQPATRSAANTGTYSWRRSSVLA